MKYTYTVRIYSSRMALNPIETRTGSLDLTERPMVGEQVAVDGIWLTISTIRHAPDGLQLVLVDYFLGRLHRSLGW